MAEEKRHPKFPCQRCGVRIEFRATTAVKVCRDCRQSDPVYVSLVSAGRDRG
jgi:ribosomal protein L37AE/L43A